MGFVRSEGLGASARSFETVQDFDARKQVPREYILGAMTASGEISLVFEVPAKARADFLLAVKKTEEKLKIESLDGWYLMASWSDVSPIQSIRIPGRGEELLRVTFRVSPNALLRDFSLDLTLPDTFHAVTEFPVIPEKITFTVAEATDKVRITNTTTGHYIGLSGGSSASTFKFYPRGLWGAYIGSANISANLEASSNLEDFFLSDGDRLTSSPAGKIRIEGQEVRYL